MKEVFNIKTRKPSRKRPVVIFDQYKMRVYTAWLTERKEKNGTKNPIWEIGEKGGILQTTLDKYPYWIYVDDFIKGFVFIDKVRKKKKKVESNRFELIDLE